jgi:hypothetical protein
MPRVSKRRFVRIQASHDPCSLGLKRSFGYEINELTRNWRRNSASGQHPDRTYRRCRRYSHLCDEPAQKLQGGGTNSVEIKQVFRRELHRR